MITIGIVATTTAVATWIAAPFVVMNRRGNLLEQQRAAMTAAPAVATAWSVVPAPRSSTESVARVSA